MPEIGTLTEIQQGTIHIQSVSSGTLHAASADVAVVELTPDPYTGAYTVTPDFSAQTLQTNGLRMTDDLTIDAIPLAETSNPAGGTTVYIGPDL